MVKIGFLIVVLFQFEEKDDTLFINEDERDWDPEVLGFSSAPDLWADGGGDTTDHIIPANALWADIRLPFVRILKDGKDKISMSLAKKETEVVKNSEISPGKKHGKRVREEWKVSSKSEEKPACNSNSSNSNINTSQPSDSRSSSNSGSSSSSSNTRREGDEGKEEVKKGENDPVVKSEQSEESAVKTENVEPETVEDVLEALKRRTGIQVRDEAEVRRRWDYKILEEENYQPDQASLNLVSDAEDTLGRRAICVSTIFRNLSFVPGNESLLGSCPGFLAICGKLILHAHWHPPRSSKQRNYDKGEEEDYADSCTSLMEQKDWWWEHLQVNSFSKITIFLLTLPPQSNNIDIEINYFLSFSSKSTNIIF